MTKELHAYQYVDAPFETVREALIVDAVGLFERATTTATGRAHTLVSNLKVTIAGLEVGKNVVVRVKRVDTHADAPGAEENGAVRFDLEWAAETNAALFPSMRASLLVYPLGPAETQLDLRGHYEPPGGVIGSAADWLVGHRIAEASVKRFVDEIAHRLGAELS